ncbi:nicotinamide riboside transporter PnuC [Mucilaginibacter koreensis]
MQHWLHLLYQELQQTTYWEWIAVVLGVAEVLLARANKVWLYPAGIISTVITIYFLLATQLYAESLLNLYYIVMSFYGWYHWVKKRHQPQVKISYNTRQEWLITIAISLGGWLVLYLFLKSLPLWLNHFIPSDVPLWDALVSSTAWAGMWLLARRKVENWLLLNFSNLLAIPLLFHKQLPLFALLTIVLFVVAIFGYLDWRKIYRQQTPVLS